MTSALRSFFSDLSFRHVARHGAALSAGAAALIVGSLRYNPEIWWNDFPPEVKAAVGPMSARAKREARIVAVPFAVLLVGLPAYSTWRLRQQRGGRLSFAAASANTFLVASAFNLFDLLVLDLWFVRKAPHGFVIPGTHDLMRRSFRAGDHVRGAAVGTLLCAVLGLVAGVLFGARPGR